MTTPFIGPLRPPISRARPYRVICISFYNEDLAELDRLVDELKERGCSRANRSALLREAIRQCDLDQAEQSFKEARR